jgi:hypothetical protein
MTVEIIVSSANPTAIEVLVFTVCTYPYLDVIEATVKGHFNKVHLTPITTAF